MSNLPILPSSANLVKQAVSKMATAQEFRSTLLEGLLGDAQKGQGTDLEVLVPTSPATIENNDDDGNEESDARNHTSTFHLHHTIVSASSRYFATFPEPRAGRVIEDIDVDSFTICVKFMYTGEYRDSLSHDNVSSGEYIMYTQ